MVRAEIFLLASLVATVPALYGATPAIEQAAVSQFEDGSPVYAPESFKAGDTVFFSLRVKDFARKDDKVNLHFDAQPLDPTGAPLVPVIQGDEATTLSPEDKQWMPKLRGSFPLPPVLLPGVYRISVAVRDQLAQANVAVDIPFTVDAIPVKPTATLGIVNLNFYLTDEAEKPMEVAAFRAGEDIHTRFQIAGFRHDESKKMDVSYGFKVISESGEEVYHQDEAAREQNADFYPKPYVPGLLVFTLSADTPLGNYTLVISATDAVGNQQVEAQRGFRIE